MEILVVCEDQKGTIHRLSREAIGEAQAIGSATGMKVAVLTLGKNAAKLAEQAAQFNVGEVLVLEHDLLNSYTADGYSTAIAQVLRNEASIYGFFGHTYQVRDYVPRIAAKLSIPFINDVVSVTVAGGKLIFSKQAFYAKLNASISTANAKQVLISFQSAAFSAENVKSGNAPVRSVAVNLTADDIKTVPEEPFQEAAGGVDLSSAELIVSIGRGIGKPENIPLAQGLAKALDAELASSRPVVDAGWLPSNHQVGSSGQSVSPKMYLALGISGAIQHVVGMKGSKNIVAINKDPEAPIFEIADYGVVGDILEIIPKLTEALNKG